MNIYEFMSGSPFLTFFIVLLVLETACAIWKRFWRAININKNGWPPPHCDADGDFKEDEE